jgi:hypothetical protein
LLTRFLLCRFLLCRFLCIMKCGQCSLGSWFLPHQPSLVLGLQSMKEFK